MLLPLPCEPGPIVPLPDAAGPICSDPVGPVPRRCPEFERFGIAEVTPPRPIAVEPECEPPERMMMPIAVIALGAVKRAIVPRS